ncbi:MAG: PEP-CTERM sorting domain-containing protein [Planctomycetota bacterium]|nr:PEP-CTERM sorting domain-containing protein [Planctomycetota bacterium]
MRLMKKQNSGRISRAATRTRLAAVVLPAIAGLGFVSQAHATQPYALSSLYTLTLPSGITTFNLSGLPETAAQNQVVGDGTGSGTGGNSHGLLWNNNTLATDMNGSFNSSSVVGTNGSQQVGFGTGGTTSFNNHAVLWTNTAASVVDIHPTNLPVITASQAYGTDGTNQVGQGQGSTLGASNNHALFWTAGNASTVVDLNPTNIAGFTSSTAYNVKGTQSVGNGRGTTPTAGNNHALLWTSGNPNSAVDLNPTNLGAMSISTAYGTDGSSQQVGIAQGAVTTNKPHAILWIGANNTAVDLTPTAINITTAFAYDTNGTNQVGYGFGTGTGNKNHALIWQGNAGSALDLNALLPAGYSSIADTIDSSGDVFGTATDTGGNTLAVEWVPVSSLPEPASISLLGLGAVGLMQRRRSGTKTATL